MPLFFGKFSYVIDKKGCWICTSHPYDKDGYPRVWCNGKPLNVSRYVYEAYHNRDLLTGQVVMHTCDNPHCIDPKHLVAGTQAENNRDRDQKGHGPRGSRNGRAKLTEDNVRKIRKKLKETITVLAEEHGVHERAIADIGAHKLWKHIADH